jgi:DNA-binding transcriptional LysR family regulator
MIGNGDFVTLLTASVVRIFRERYSLKVLPTELPAHRSPVGIVTLKNRTVAPAVRLFIQCAREVTKSITDHDRK